MQKEFFSADSQMADFGRCNFLTRDEISTNQERSYLHETRFLIGSPIDLKRKPMLATIPLVLGN